MRGYYGLCGAPEYSNNRENNVLWGFLDSEIADHCQPRENWKIYYEMKKKQQYELYEKVLGQSNMIPACMSGP